MNPDQLEKLFAEALEHEDPLDRARFLDQACGGDIELRQRAQKLIQAHEKAASFLSDPSRRSSEFNARLEMPLAEKAGDKIGRYKLLQQIGEGGCGVVYMAEQEEPVRRRVALKVIKLGMDTKTVIARFEAERQALALMDHPNIAKVLDAGATETGRPYFVMELVPGNKITEFCDENNVTTQDRLKLVIQVCQAIQHAHQKGVIHRDIKPSNILVTINDSIPAPKVIDFGIAKATAGRLTDQTLFTAFDQFIGTPAYMSPEQAVMTSLDIDTRSDIYSLGVLLYELLVGCTPFDQKELLAAGLDEMRRTIREKEPPKPSTRLVTMVAGELTATAKHRRTEAPKLLHVVRGDLDWIVMKCLEKERGRRYETANGLAADIQRHLSNEPVTARPPSKLYEFQKTVRRHKFGFAAATSLMLVLMLGVLASAWQAIRATQAVREQDRLRREAVSEKQRSEQVARFLTEMLRAAGPSVARGRDATVLREILEKTRSRIEKELTNEPEVSGDLWTAVGSTYADIGDHAQAIEMHSRAVTNYRAAFRTNHTKLALALGHLGTAQSYKENIAVGSSNAGLGLVMARQLGDQRTLASSLIRYANSLDSWGKVGPESVPYLREAIAIRQKFGTNDALMAAYSTLAVALTNLPESIEITRMVLNYSLQKTGEEDTATANRRFILGQKLLLNNQPGEAEVELRAALQSWRKLHTPDHPYRNIIFRHFVESLEQQKKFLVLARACEQESLSFPTNIDLASMALAARVTAGELPLMPTNQLLALESKINKRGSSFNAAIALARTGQMEEYRRVCQELLKRGGQKRDLVAAEQAAKAALLFPSDAATVAAAGSLADLAAAGGMEERLLPWALSTKALAEYRRGNFSTAIEFANRALAEKDVWRACEATAYCIHALAYASLGDETKARAALSAAELAEAKETEAIVTHHWHMREYWGFRDWIMSAFLKAEAESLLNDASKTPNSPR